MLAYPDWPLTSLSMLDPAERQHLLVEWNQTSRPVASPAFIHQLFEEQAQRNPGATALMSSSGSRTYAELNDKANRIGHQLRNYGLRQGEPICILLDRSVEMIEAVLGVVKAGGAYVPLDPSQPSLRHQAILTSLRARFLITSAEVAGTGGWLESVDTLHHVVCIGQSSKDVSAYIGNLHISNASALDSHPLSHLTPIGSSGQPAYIIFTSGSTGTPKGVVVTHAALLNLIDWANTTFDIGPADRGIVISSLSFDLSVYDIFGLLGGGASLYVATKEELRDPERVISLLRENSITFWNSAPGAIQQLVPLWPESESFDNLRLVFLSGDWIPVRLPDQIRRRARNANVIGLGGATEATVWSNFFCIKDVDPAWASIPYGRPIQNSQYFILDRNLLPCPLGVPGNLYIAGECLALGYWQEPVLTAQQFVPNPFGARPGERLYATGDLARHKDDGNLEFLGRTDHQVKIRGFRVEISEVEAALRQHPLVSAVIVLAQQDRDRSRRLIAYIVPVNEAELVGADQLRAILQQRLPEYMIPSAFITIASFPLTSNGKVDLVALQKLAPSPSGARRSTLSHTEEAVASIWSTLLGIEDIGQDDNFFALGGHSILATEMISQIRRCLRRNVSLLSIFEAPTLGAFSNKVAMCIAAAATNRTFASHLVAIQSNGDRQPLFLVHPIGGGVSCYADLARALGPTQPLYAFEAEELSRLTPDVRRYETLEILASNYVNTLLDAEPRGPYLLGGWSFGGIVAFEMARQLHARGRSDIILFLLDSKPPLALPSYDDTTLALGLATELAQQAGKPLKLSHEEFSRLALDERWSVLLFRLKSNKLVPTNTDASALMQIVAGFRVREKCARNYVPGIYSGRLTLFRATERNLNMPKPGNLDDTYGWAQYCTQPIEVIHVPGSHATIGLEPNVAVVADRIRQQIELTTFIKLA
jgi:amino acid adenylation domain-containing protein